MVKPKVIELNGKPVTTSLEVARVFKKEHFHVLRDIENILGDDDFSDSNFGCSNYLSKQGKSNRMYTMTRDAWMLLVMGFTGDKALEIKKSYIAQFNKMESVILNDLSIGDKKWAQARLDGKLDRTKLTDVIQQVLIPHAEKQGSKNAHMYFNNFTKMTNKTLIAINDVKKNNKKDTVRDYLRGTDLGFLGYCEERMAQKIIDGCESDVFYKDIFQQIKSWCVATSELMGKINPGTEKRLPPGTPLLT